MSHKLISHNPDLKKLRDEGYELELKRAYLLVRNVPYLNSKKEIKTGTLISALDLAGDATVKPKNHVVNFVGEHPCNKDGTEIKAIKHSSGRQVLAEGLEADHSFSNKPPNGYKDYHDKITTYIRIIESPAQAIDRSVSARAYRPVETNDDPECVFKYLDTNSSRAEIDTISDRLKDLKVAIVGLGGTGSYILDFVAKTPVREIHLFDADRFLSHNAFRAPGAASIELLRKEPTKVAYLCGVYSEIHKYVVPHEYHLIPAVCDELSGMSFVFICMDDSESKQAIITKLLELKIPFIDVGIGVLESTGKLMGNVRTTTITAGKNDHLKDSIPLKNGGDNEYSKNIQIAEINAINAALAVIKWKKIFDVYHDQEKEHHSVYDITVNKIFNK